MSILIVWSTTDGGSAITDAVDHGDVANGASSSASTIFVRHNGSNNITNVALYIRQYSGTYSGSFTAAADLSEVINWGDQETATAFGGMLVNFRADLSYASGWATYADKEPTGGFVHRTGVGDSEANAVTVPTYTGATASGEIQTGVAPGVEMRMRVDIPSDEDTIGIRQWETVMRYSYTS